MGYWSKHPMGGDLPLDFKDKIEYELFSKEELDAELYYDKEEFKLRLTEKLKQIKDMDFTGGSTTYPEDGSFVLPFLIVEYEIRIENQILSQQIKRMIKDGGAKGRDYPIPLKGMPGYPTQVNGYNELQSPFDYAIKLYDMWDDLMTGKRSFDEMDEDQGLFAALQNNIGQGSVNQQ